MHSRFTIGNCNLFIIIILILFIIELHVLIKFLMHYVQKRIGISN